MPHVLPSTGDLLSPCGGGEWVFTGPDPKISTRLEPLGVEPVKNTGTHMATDSDTFHQCSPIPGQYQPAVSTCLTCSIHLAFTIPNHTLSDYTVW